MKNTTIDNPEEVKIKDKRIITLDEIVNEIEAIGRMGGCKMNILEIGIEKRKTGWIKIGRAEGEAIKLVSMIRRKLEKGLSVTAISEALGWKMLMYKGNQFDNRGFFQKRSGNSQDTTQITKLSHYIFFL